MKYLKLFLVWRSFTHWWLNLFISIGLKKPIDWIQKVNDMTKITNDALDASGKVPPETPAVPTEPEVKPTKKRLIDRIRDRRNKTPAENSSRDYKIW